MGVDLIWNECSLNVSDTCGCAAWHVAPTPRTVMLVAMQARSVRRALLACHIRWHRRVARTLGSPCAQSRPAPPNARQVRKGAHILLLSNVATSGRGLSARAPRQTGPKRLRFVLSSAPAETPDHPGGASCILPDFLHITAVLQTLKVSFAYNCYAKAVVWDETTVSPPCPTNLLRVCYALL